MFSAYIFSSLLIGAAYSSKHWPDENQRCSDTNPLISQYMGYGASMLYDSGYNENARYASDHFNKARLAIGNLCHAP